MVASQTATIIYLGNPEFLHGEGGWRDLDLDIVLGKRCRNSADDFLDNGSVRSSSPVFEEEWIDVEHDDGDTRNIRRRVVEQGEGNDEEVDVSFFQLFICFW